MLVTCTVEPRNYASPRFVHASIGQGGLFVGPLHFSVTTITDHRMPRGRAISVLSLAIRDSMGKTQEKRQSKAQ